MGFENFADNLDVRQHLEALGYVQEGDVITPDDYTAIEQRAKVLIREARERGATLSEEAAVPMAYVDRLVTLGRLGLERIVDTVEPETLRKWLSAMGNREYTVEESEAFIRYMQGREVQGLVLTEVVKKWLDERAQATAGMPTFAVTDATDTVRGLGNSPETLMREAQDK